jgi:hypothetical protein
MRTSQNFQETEGVYNTLPSQTVPDQSLTLRQLLTNYTRGQELPSNKVPAFFDENEYIPDIKRMDLVDIQEMMEGNAQKAVKLQKHLKDLENPSKTIITSTNDNTNPTNDGL